MTSKKALQEQITTYKHQGNYDEMVKSLRQIIEEYEDHASMYFLAKYYIDNNIPHEDIFSLLEKSAKRNNTEALLELYEITKDVTYLIKGSKLGSGMCSSELALYYWNTEKNDENAEKYFNIAIEQKDSNAMNNYARFLMSKDRAKAIHYYKEACKEKNAIALFNFAKIIPEDTEDLIDLSFIDEITMDSFLPLEQFLIERKTKISEEMTTPIKRANVKMYYYEKLLIMSSVKLNIYACLELLQYYNSIKEFDKELEQGELYVFIYTQLNEKTPEFDKIYLMVIARLSYLYERRKEYKLMNEYYSESVRLGDYIAMQRYSFLIEDEFLPPHIERADAGDVNECLFLSFYYNQNKNEGDVDKMLKYLLVASKTNYIAMYFLGKYYKTKNNIAEMLEMFNKALKLHNSPEVADELASFWKGKNNQKLADYFAEKREEWTPKE